MRDEYWGQEDITLYPDDQEAPAKPSRTPAQGPAPDAMRARQQRGFLMMIMIMATVGLSMFLAVSTGDYRILFWGLIGAFLVFLLFRAQAMRADRQPPTGRS